MKKVHTTYYFKLSEIVAALIAVVVALATTFMVGARIGAEQTINTASYYSDGEDERGGFYELEFFGGHVERYYWKEGLK